MEKNASITYEEVMNSSDEIKKKVTSNYTLYNIEPYNICRIIESIDDDSYKLMVVENMNRIDFRAYQVMGIILSISDDANKKEILKHRRRYKIDGDPSVIKILFSMSDESIKDVLDHYTEYKFPSNTFCNIIKSLKDDKLKKKVLKKSKYYKFNEFDISRIVSSIDDDEYKIKYVNKLYKTYADHSCIATIVSSISDDIYKYTLFNDYKKYKFSSEDIISVATSFKDQTYTYKILDDHNLYEFNSDVLTGIISGIEDDFYKSSVVIENIYNFSPVQLTKIVESLSAEETKEDIMNILYNKGVFGTSVMDRSLVLPVGMSIGIEIETEGDNSKVIREDILPKGWTTYDDCSLKDGVEIISPILYSGDEEEINHVCSILKQIGQCITNRCAGHIHIGSSFFYEDVDSYKYLLELFANAEGLIYLISNQEGDLPRRGIVKYSSPISKKIDNFRKVEPVDFSTINNFNDFSDKIKQIQGSKFVSINFRNLGTYNKDTIEFRMPNGTLDPNVWIDNINLFGSLMYISKSISNIMKKSVSNLTDDEMMTLYCYSKIKDQTITERSRLKYLLNLFPDGVKKGIYLNRYDVNREISRGLFADDLVDFVDRCRPVVITKPSDELKEAVVENYKKHLEKAKLVRKR